MELNSINKSLSFDDVLIKPAKSSVLPNEVSTKTQITSKISLGIPLISSAMDTVTEYQLAIAMAQSGGLGILHKNMSIELQAQNVSKVKKFETGIVIDPVTISPEKNLSDALDLMKQKHLLKDVLYHNCLLNLMYLLNLVVYSFLNQLRFSYGTYF